MKQFNYFKELTKERENRLKVFDHIAPKEFDEISAQALELFNAQKVTAEHGAKNFDNATAFISGADTLNGFYICGADLRNAETKYKLYLIAFDVCRHYDFNNHTRKPDTLRPVAIYKDSNENLYTLEAIAMDLKPLEDWQKELKRRADEARNRAEIWQRVKRNYKKDGKPFAILSKNFDGVKVIEEYGALKLEIYGRTEKNIFVSDTLYNSERFPLKNIDDIIPSIKKYIEYLTESAKEYENILNNSAKIYDDVFSAIYEKILKYQTPSNADGIRLEHFYYTLREMINNLYISL